MNKKRFCPILMSGFLARTQEHDFLDSQNDRCTCNEDCAWYAERSLEKCSFINGIICMGMGMER